MTVTAAAVEPQHHIDQTLNSVIAIKAQIRILEAQLEPALDAITEAMQAGDLDPAFSHEDWAFHYNQGRTSTTYSPEAKAAIKGIQNADITSGRAVQKTGSGFWVIKAPSL